MKYLNNFNRLEVYLLVYSLSINITSFLIYGLDKVKAMRKTWRVPELHLTLLALAGGGTGALCAMTVFKHKLSKKRFNLGIPIIILINLLARLYIWNAIK